MEYVRVGLLGLGTIGSGVSEALLDGGYRQRIEKRYGVIPVLARAYDTDDEKLQAIPPEARCESAKKLLDDPEVDVVVELIGIPGGDYTPANDFMLGALERGKQVVTANKAVLAQYGEDIFSRAREKDLCVGFEASVCGSIPIINILKQSVDEIESVSGIFNGTTNYILTRMGEDLDYMDALIEAQQKGFAEADPTSDLEGIDAAQKLAILARLAFNIRADALSKEGITGVDKGDLGYARTLSNPCTVKLIAMAKKHDGKLELGVYPVMVPESHQLASVRNETNAVYVVGEHFGPQIYTGKGAGKEPTADAVMRDIVDVGRCMATGKTNLPALNDEKLEVLDPGEVEYPFYLRFSAVNVPGVLARIAGVLGDMYKINIVSANQPGNNPQGEPADIVIVTDPTKYGNMRKALDEIKRVEKKGTKIVAGSKAFRIFDGA